MSLRMRSLIEQVICLQFPQRKHPRLKEYDYATPAAYFVTICTQNRQCLLSNIVGRGLAPAELRYTQYGKIAAEQMALLEKRYPAWKVDQYVIMPNHIHAILILEETAGASPRPTLTDVVCAYKSLTTKYCKKYKPIEKLFQNSFYEHIIRGKEDYLEIAEYILGNPDKWHEDKLYAEG